MSERTSREPARTDRGAWLLVAARDFRVRLRDKGFFISTGITLAVLTVFILLRAFAGESTPAFALGVAGDPDRLEVWTSQIEVAAQRRGVVVGITPTDAAAGEDAVRSGRLDALLDDGVLVGARDVPAQLSQVVQDGLVRARLEAALTEGGASATEIDDLLNQPAVTVRTLEPRDPQREEHAGIAFIAVLLAYGQLFGYGVWVATGVIEEKASRVVEILLSAIRPRQLLAGKIAGIGALGIVQLTAIAAYAIVLALATGALPLPRFAVGIAIVVLAWFVMGFAFYAGLFAVSGSLVSRMEELQNAMVPVNLIIFISFFISIGALEDPDSTLSIVASILPFSSSLAMPVRIALGAATPAQIASSVALLVGGTLVLVPISARLYAGAVLKTGSRVKLRDAWRSASAATDGP